MCADLGDSRLIWTWTVEFAASCGEEGRDEINGVYCVKEKKEAVPKVAVRINTALIQPDRLPVNVGDRVMMVIEL